MLFLSLFYFHIFFFYTLFWPNLCDGFILSNMNHVYNVYLNVWYVILSFMRLIVLSLILSLLSLIFIYRLTFAVSLFSALRHAEYVISRLNVNL